MKNRDDDESWALKQICVAYILLPTYRNEIFNNMPANSLLIYTPLTLDRVKRSNIFFLKRVMLHIKIQGKKFRSLCKQKHDHVLLGWVYRLNIINCDD